MRDIWEAAERQSATLAMSVETIARRRGWGARTLSGMLMDPDGVGRPMMVYGASVLLPGGRPSFIPAPRPRIDGDTWMIDVRRSDGVSRPEWNPGISIRRLNGSYSLMFGNQMLDEQILSDMLDAMGND
jgi:hypothetical protein